MNILKRNAIASIFKHISEKQKELEHRGFFYFDDPILINGKFIDRVDNQHFYYKEEIIPMNWNKLDGYGLLNVLTRIQSNKFFIMKNINNIYYKMRLKNKKPNDQHQPY
jgi:hypothetical protein